MSKEKLTLDVMVEDDNGEPVAGAEVTVNPGTRSAVSATTDEDGECVVELLTPGVGAILVKLDIDK